MIEAMYLYHLARGPLRVMAKGWMCRRLARVPSGSLPRLVRLCPDALAIHPPQPMAVAQKP